MEGEVEGEVEGEGEVEVEREEEELVGVDEAAAATTAVLETPAAAERVRSILTW